MTNVELMTPPLGSRSPPILETFDSFDDFQLTSFELGDSLTINNAGNWLQARFVLDEWEEPATKWAGPEAKRARVTPEPTPRPRIAAVVVISSAESYGCLDNELESLM